MGYNLKILFQGTQDHHIPGCEYNLGGAAVVTCTAKMLRDRFPGAEISSMMQLSQEFASKNNIKVINNRQFLNRHYSISESLKSNSLYFRCLTWKFLRKYCHVDFKLLTRNPIIEEYLRADLVIDLGMDCFNDNFGMFITIDHCRDLALGIILNKPVILFAESPGPFKNRMARWLARYILNRVSLITIREKNSYKYLKKMGVNNPALYLTADPAFLFGKDETARLKMKISEISDGRPRIAIIPPDGILLNAHNSLKGQQQFIKQAYVWARYLLPERVFTALVGRVEKGINISSFRKEKRNVVIQNIADMAEELSSALGAQILLIPHVLTPDKMEKDYDARTTIRQIYEKVKNKTAVVPITENFTAQEMKGLIGSCDMVISSKFHAAIAATSQCIPTLLIGSNYHYKNKALMDMLGLEKWNCQNISADLTITAKKLWQERSEVKEGLKKRIPEIQKLSLSNGQLVFDLLDRDLIQSSELRY